MSVLDDVGAGTAGAGVGSSATSWCKGSAATGASAELAGPPGATAAAAPSCRRGSGAKELASIVDLLLCMDVRNAGAERLTVGSPGGDGLVLQGLIMRTSSIHGTGPS